MLTAGTVSIDANGNASGSGLALLLFFASVAGLVIPSDPKSAPAKTLALTGIAEGATAMAGAIVGYLNANGPPAATLNVSVSGPAVMVSDSLFVGATGGLLSPGVVRVTCALPAGWRVAAGFAQMTSAGAAVVTVSSHTTVDVAVTSALGAPADGTFSLLLSLSPT